MPTAHLRWSWQDGVLQLLFSLSLLSLLSLLSFLQEIQERQERQEEQERQAPTKNSRESFLIPASKMRMSTLPKKMADLKFWGQPYYYNRIIISGKARKRDYCSSVLAKRWATTASLTSLTSICNLFSGTCSKSRSIRASRASQKSWSTLKPTT